MPEAKKLTKKQVEGGKFAVGRWWNIVLMVAVLCAYQAYKTFTLGAENNLESASFENICPFHEKLVADDFDSFKSTIDVILKDKTFRENSASKLSNAVQIVTEVDDQTKFLDLDDPFFERFKQFHEYLKATFPGVHTHLTLDKVNKYGLVYTWKGTNENLQPILLAAHQDVVPVEWDTADRWTYPPYSGYYDGKRVWGRGATDCKSLLIGLLESVELLLEDKFVPKRTVVLAFGFDEEASGILGASTIAQFLVAKYGKNSFYVVIDEGIPGVLKFDNRYIVAVPTSEKGYFDSHISLTTPGGHSSVPPDHTAIGIASQLISLIESNPFNSTLPKDSPINGVLTCIAAHAAHLPLQLKKNILNAQKSEAAKAAVLKYLQSDKMLKYLVTTSQATDMITGGIKSNALPESVSIVVNSRVNVDTSVAQAADKYLSEVVEIAEKFNLGVIFEGKEIRPTTKAGYFNYSIATPLEPAPLSPTSGETWDIFSGTLRHFYEDLAYPDKIDNEIIVASVVATFNTDTKFYWDLSSSIYRYQPGPLMIRPSLNGIHSVDEFVDFDGHLNVIAFYYEYLRNVDAFST